MLEISRQGNHITLVGEATIHDAVELHTAALEVAEAHAEVIVDIGGLGAVDTAGLQILLSLGRTRPTTVVGCPVGIRKQLERVGLARELLGGTK